MLATRNTAAFKAASLLQYGTVGSLTPRRRTRDPRTTAGDARRRGDVVGAQEIADAARALVGKYQAVGEGFDARHRGPRRCRQPAGLRATS